MRPGKFVDIDTGKVVGCHTGIHNYTLGQRCKIGGKPCKYYVVHKNIATQEILVVSVALQHLETNLIIVVCCSFFFFLDTSRSIPKQ